MLGSGTVTATGGRRRLAAAAAAAARHHCLVIVAPGPYKRLAGGVRYMPPRARGSGLQMGDSHFRTEDKVFKSCGELSTYYCHAKHVTLGIFNNYVDTICSF